MEVAVSEYVQMDNKTVFLVTVTGTPEEGKAFAYGDNVMYKTTAYGENVYSWLVIVDKNEHSLWLRLRPISNRPAPQPRK